VNGGNDFDEEMLDEVYIAIKYVYSDCTLQLGFGTSCQMIWSLSKLFFNS